MTILFRLTLLIGFCALIYSPPAFATSDADIMQKLHEHFQTEDHIVREMALSQINGDDNACQDFAAQNADVKTFISQSDGMHKITAIGRATMPADKSDPVYNKLHAETHSIAEQICHSTQNSRVQNSYSANGRCSNTDPKTGYPHRIVTSGFTCGP
jgi:hypothetical protein